MKKEYELIQNFIDFDIDTNYIKITFTDQNIPYYDKHFFIMYDNKDINLLIRISEVYKKSKYFVFEKEYRINKLFYSVFVFRLPDQLDLDLNTSDVYKNSIIVNYIPHSDYIESVFDKIEELYGNGNYLGS